MSEHIGAEEAQALLDAATPGPWYWHDYMKSARTLAYDPSPTLGFDVHEMNVLKTTDDWHPTRADEALIAAAPRLAAEVVRLRRELDARTDQPTAKELLHAVDIQYRAAPPKLPETWTRTEVAHYRHGWLDAMQRVKDSTDTAAAARLLGGGE